MSVVWAILAALGLGIIANNLYDLMPWLAHRILRRAAKLEAESPDEAPLIYAESVAVLDEVPGKLTKLLFATGRLTRASRHLQWRPRRRRRRIEPADRPWLARVLRRWVRTKDAVRDLLLMGMWSNDDWNHPLLLIRPSSEHDERRSP